MEVCVGATGETICACVKRASLGISARCVSGLTYFILSLITLLTELGEFSELTVQDVYDLKLGTETAKCAGKCLLTYIQQAVFLPPPTGQSKEGMSVSPCLSLSDLHLHTYSASSVSHKLTCSFGLYYMQTRAHKQEDLLWIKETAQVHQKESSH